MAALGFTMRLCVFRDPVTGEKHLAQLCYRGIPPLFDDHGNILEMNSGQWVVVPEKAVHSIIDLEKGDDGVYRAKGMH